MHVGLNLLFLVPGETGGMEVAARELLPVLVRTAPQIRFTAYINREAAEVADGPWGQVVPATTVPVRSRRRQEWVWGEQALLPRLAARAGCDVLHSLGSTAPGRGRFRRVVTIHDVIFHRHPEAHGGLRALGMRALVPLAARRAHRIVADSQATRDDLVELLHVPAAKVDVVPLAARRLAALPLAEPELRARLALGDRRLILSTSAKRPHKNLARLLEAHALLPAEDRPLLVLPGYPTDHEAELRAVADRLGVADDVLFLGWIDDPTLEGLYAAASLFAFPSLYEGFGLPVLEAMQRGVPVACSTRSSLAEVAGDAARLFDPTVPASIAGAMRAVLDDRDEAARLREAGLAQSARFTWEATAAGYVGSYARALGRP